MRWLAINSAHHLDRLKELVSRHLTRAHSRFGKRRHCLWIVCEIRYAEMGHNTVPATRDRPRAQISHHRMDVRTRRHDGSVSMKAIGRSVLAVLVGVIVTMGLIMGLENVCSSLYPLPP